MLPAVVVPPTAEARVVPMVVVPTAMSVVSTGQ